MGLLDIEMVPIGIDDLMPNSPTEHNVYIRLSADRFVTLYKKDSIPSSEHLHKYKTKDIDTLWVEKSAMITFVKKNVTLASLASRSATVANNKKAALFVKATDSMFKQIEYCGMTGKTYEQSKSLAESFFQYAQDNQDVATLIDSLNEFDSWIVRRSILVSFFSVCIAMELENIGTTQIKSVSVAGLLHDIGLIKLPKNIVTRPLDQLTNEEMQIYKTHPDRGRELVDGIDAVHDDVLTIIHQHHERPSGSGYPMGINKSKIHILSQIVATADEFSDLLLKAPHRPRVLPIELAMTTYIENNESPINKSISRAFGLALKKRMF
tara:strand:- start:143043 stop:144011 length:969 start_codon:yes stop_codon:yes gene_type:complete